MLPLLLFLLLCCGCNFAWESVVVAGTRLAEIPIKQETNGVRNLSMRNECTKLSQMTLFCVAAVAHADTPEIYAEARPMKLSNQCSDTASAELFNKPFPKLIKTLLHKMFLP